jgi:hypothetical protein
MPKGQWKEVKKRHTFWHRVLFNDPTSLTFFDTGGGVQVSSISSQDQFINDRVTPALAALYPNIPEYTVQGLLFKLPNSKKLHFNLYYFFGAFQDLGKDVSKLVPFDGAHSFFLANNVNVPVAGTNVEAWGITLNNVRGKSDGPNGAYCVVLEMLDVSPLGIEYVVLDNVITKNTIVFDPGGDL